MHFKYAPGPYLKSTLQEHIANMLLEQYAFQIWSWSIFNLENSFRLLMVQDHKSRSKSFPRKQTQIFEKVGQINPFMSNFCIWKSWQNFPPNITIFQEGTKFHIFSWPDKRSIVSLHLGGFTKIHPNIEKKGGLLFITLSLCQLRPVALNV